MIRMLHRLARQMKFTLRSNSTVARLTVCAVLLGGIGFSPVSFGAAADPERQIIVRFKPGVISTEISVRAADPGSRSFAALAVTPLPVPGVELKEQFRFSKPTATIQRRGIAVPSAGSSSFDISVLRITDPTAKRGQIIADLMASGQVEYAEPDFIMSATAIPDDSSFGTMWGLNNTGQSGGVIDADIDAPEAWDITKGSEDVVVGVIDSGVRYDHPDLVDNMWRNPGETGLDGFGQDKATNGVDDDSNGWVDDVYGIDCKNNDADPMEDNSHGTHVAGTIGAQGNNNNQVVGVNWEVSIMALKYLGSNGFGSTSDAVQCLNYAHDMKVNHGINILLTNNSYGGGGYSMSMLDAIQSTQDAGMLFVAAAGNDLLDNDIVPHYPSSYDLDSIIAVAGTNRSDARYTLSNLGSKSVDLGAPGQSILSTFPVSGTATLSGTSMASPHVAGVAALLWADDPNRTWQQVKGLIMDTANPIPAMDGVTVTGARLNAYDALTCTAGDPKMYVQAPENGSIVMIGEDNLVAIKLSDCGENVTGATVTVTPDSGEPTFSLFDNGVAPDAAAGDGIYSANWIAGVAGTVVLDFTALDGAIVVNRSISVTTAVVPDYAVEPAHPYSWVESSNGTDIGLGSVDDAGAEVGLGFDFNFYGVSYNTVWAHSNGMLKFGSDVELNFFQFLEIPATSNPDSFIAVFLGRPQPQCQ